MSGTKKSLLTSGLALLVSAAMLVGMTFAWFTDSVTNTGNAIKAGTLKISLNDEADTPLFDSNDFLFEPGRSQKAEAAVKNVGSLWLKYTLSFENVELDNADGVEADITKVLEVYTVDASAKNLDDATPLGTMAELMKQDSFTTEAVLAPSGKSGEVNGEQVDDIDTIALVIKMQDNADNEYQGAGVKFDVNIQATQYTYEEDGFGSDQYDKEAVYPVTNANALTNALKKGGVVVLGGDISYTAAENPDIDTNGARTIINTKTTLDLSDNKITFDSGDGNNNWAAFYLNGFANVTVDGTGTIDAYASTGGYCFNLGGTMLMKPTLTINGGTYIGTPSAVSVQYGTAYINGGFFDCRPAGNVTDDLYRYTLNCIDANYKNGTAKIIVTGGTFVNFNPANNQAEGPGTNFVAEGYKVISEEKTDGDIWYTVVPE